MTKKNVISLVSFALCVLLLISALSFLLRGKESSFDNFYEEPENTIDVMFVGSSHVYSGYCPAVLWKEYGISSYNIYGWTVPIWTSYYYLCEALKTQSPGVVFLDVSSINCPYGTPESVEKTAENREQNVWIRPGIERMLLTFESLTTDSELFDLALTHNVWKSPSSIELKHEPDKELAFLRNFGPLFNRVEYGVFNYDFIDDITAPTDTDVKYLDKFVDLAEKKDFKLVFVLTPYEADEQQTTITNWVRQYAEQNEIDFIDFMRDDGVNCGFDYRDDMADNDHVNVNGAIKLTRYCGDYLKNNRYVGAAVNANSEKITSDSNATYRMFEYEDLFANDITVRSLADWFRDKSDVIVNAYMPSELSEEQRFLVDSLELVPFDANSNKQVEDNMGFEFVTDGSLVRVVLDNGKTFFETDKDELVLAIYDNCYGRLTYVIDINNSESVTWKEYTKLLRGAGDN